MNIAILAESLMLGGANRYCLDLANGLRTYPGTTVSLLALPDRRTPWLSRAAQAREMDVQVLPMHGAFDVRIVRELRCYLTEQRVDVLHSQGYRSNIIARLVVRTGRLPTRLVCTMHGLHYFPDASPRLRLFFLLDYLSMSTTDRIIAVSRDTQSQLMRWRLRGKTQVIHNGAAIPPPVDAEARRIARLELGIAPDAQVVAFVGRFAQVKGADVLLEAARETIAATTKAVFLLVGDGPLMPEIQRCAQELSPQLRLFGCQEDVTLFYRAADVVFLPSRSEGLPMTLIEAFAHSLPAVGSHVGGIPEVITDGVNGFLCDPLNVTQMCERLVRLLENDVLRQNFALQARRTAETYFSLDRMIRETHAVYRSLIQG